MFVVPPPYTVAKIQEVMETVLSFFDVLSSDPAQLYTLCAVAIPSTEIALLKSTGRIVSEVLEQDYVGIGDSSLLRYLVPILCNVFARDNQVLTEEALWIGTYLVLKAKAYIDGCGGDTDAMILHPNGSFETKSAATYNIEQHWLRLEHQLTKALGAFLDANMATARFQDEAKRLVDLMSEEHDASAGTAVFRAEARNQMSASGSWVKPRSNSGK